MEFYSILLWLVMLIMSIDINQAIFNGSRVEENTFNYQVSLLEDCKYVCSGAIIDTWHILTAAHCFLGSALKKYHVFAGSKCLASNCGSFHSVKNIYIPTAFEILREIKPDNTTVTYAKGDIAVLRLSTPLIFGMNIAAVKLPLRDVFYTGKQSVCKAAGWGCTECGVLQLSKYLLWTEAYLLAYEECARLVPVTEDMICTLDPHQTTTLLQGDSGSGLVCGDTLVGIASASKGVPHLPVRYVNVYDHLPFIYHVRKLDYDELHNIAKPDTGPVTEPVTEPVSEPATEPVPESVPATATEPTTERAPEPKRNHIPCICL